MAKRSVFYRIGDAVLNPRLPRPKLRKKQRKADQIPRVLEGYFAKRGLGWPEYVMLKVQIAFMVLFGLLVVRLVFFQSLETIFLIFMLVMSAYVVALTPTQLKRAFRSDYPAYRAFVGLNLGLVWGFVLLLKQVPLALALESVQTIALFVLLLILAVFLSFAGFRIRYGRNYTFGTVETIRGNKAIVKVNYDIRSNVKAGLYLAETFVRVKRGDRVKIGVDRPLFGLRGSTVRAVLGKIASRPQKSRGRTAL